MNYRALLVIDAQNDLMNEDGLFPIPNASQFKPVIGNVIKFFRSRLCPVMYIQNCYNGSESQLVSRGGSIPLHCMTGTPGQQNISEATPREDEMVYFKTIPNIFEMLPEDAPFKLFLKKALIEKNIKEIWICGLVGNKDVELIAAGLHSYGFDTYVFDDATVWIDNEEDNKEQSIKRMREAGVHIVRFV